MSFFDQQEAERAIDIASSLVERMFDEPWIRRQDFHLMVSRRQRRGTFDILAERSYGNVEDCKNIYRPIVVSKTGISARTGLNSREAQLLHPLLIDRTDTKYWGSVIKDDIIVAGSGEQAFVDEGIALTTLAICMMLAQQNMEIARADADRLDRSFFNR